MHLTVKVFEDVRGSRSAQADLSLHGPIPWPDASVSEWVERTWGSSAEQMSWLSKAGARFVASLEVFAPDELANRELIEVLRAMQPELAQPKRPWVERGPVAALLGLSPSQEAVAEEMVGTLIEEAIRRLKRRELSTLLKVGRIKLTDFRAISNLTLDMSMMHSSNVLVGVNGAGKSTVLDAIALLLSHLTACVRKAPKRPRLPTDTDITNGLESCQLEITAEMDGNPVTWSLEHKRGEKPADASERQGLYSLNAQVESIRQRLERGDVSLPIVVHYPVNRAVLDIPLRIKTAHEFEPLEAYDGALAEGSSNFRLFFEWFRQREDLENETRIRDSKHRDGQLEAVRRAIQKLVPGLSELRVQRSPLGMLVNKGEWTLYVDQLSDGEKCLLAMAGDLARRLAIANPFADDPLQGGGVVLIDEIELHLHPCWQRRIIPALERAFPGCQFILTTHSPAVLSYVEPESVFILEPKPEGLKVSHPDFSKGMDVNRILEDLLDTPSRPEETEQKLALMYQKLDEGNLPQARAIHSELASTLGNDDPALVRAEVLLRRREAGRR